MLLDLSSAMGKLNITPDKAVLSIFQNASRSINKAAKRATEKSSESVGCQELSWDLIYYQFFKKKKVLP